MSATLPGMPPPPGPHSCSRGCVDGFIELTEGPEAGLCYPCPQCRRGAFEKWAGKHYLPTHDKAHCAECNGSAPKLGRSPLTTAPRRSDEDS